MLISLLSSEQSDLFIVSRNPLQTMMLNPSLIATSINQWPRIPVVIVSMRDIKLVHKSDHSFNLDISPRIPFFGSRNDSHIGIRHLRY